MASVRKPSPGLQALDIPEYRRTGVTPSARR